MHSRRGRQTIKNRQENKSGWYVRRWLSSKKRVSEWVEGVPEGRGSFKNGSWESPRERLADGESVSYADVIRTPGRKASAKAPRQERASMFKKEQRCWGLERGECEEGPERKEVGGRRGSKGQTQRGVAFVKMEAFLLRETGSLGRVWAEE